jgi:hypothetical protein
MQEEEEKSPYEDRMREAFFALPQVCTPDCLTDEALTGLVDQKGKFPDSTLLLLHLASCTYCSERFQETRALMQAAGYVSAQPESPQNVAERVKDWWAGLLTAQRRRLLPALVLPAAAVLIFAIVLSRPGLRDRAINAPVLNEIEIALARVETVVKELSLPATRGSHNEPEKLIPESPVATHVLSDKVILRWQHSAERNTVTGKTYKIDIQEILPSGQMKEALKPIYVSGAITCTVRLPRGKTYTWQVSHTKDDYLTAMPPASFQILSEDEAREVETKRQGLQKQPFALGLFYIDKGLLDEAEQTLKSVPASDPRHSDARKLQDAIQNRAASR